MCLIKMPQKHAIKNVLNTVQQQLKSTVYPGADPGIVQARPSQDGHL